jgi:hypothetical protein
MQEDEARREARRPCESMIEPPTVHHDVIDVAWR